MSEQVQPQKSYQVFNNIIVLPLDILSLALKVNDDNTLTPISGSPNDEAGDVLNRTRRSAYTQLERMRSNLRSHELAMKMLDLFKEMGGGSDKVKFIGEGLEQTDKEKADLKITMDGLQDFMDSSAELMLDYNLPIKQIGSDDILDAGAASAEAKNLLDKLQGKQ
ncbi:hypothetical protein D3C87_278590 [compost metagenome]